VTTYFETSAIVKLVMMEEGSDRADILWDSSDLLATSRLSYAEARAALAAARRTGRLTSRGLEQAKDALNARFAELDQVDVTAKIVRSAGDIAEQHELRGYDAVHLASALALETTELILVTWDSDLARAGRQVRFDLAGIDAD
jgi:predicted nucleic acid-binding protein